MKNGNLIESVFKNFGRMAVRCDENSPSVNPEEMARTKIESIKRAYGNSQTCAGILLAYAMTNMCKGNKVERITAESAIENILALPDNSKSISTCDAALISVIRDANSGSILKEKACAALSEKLRKSSGNKHYFLLTAVGCYSDPGSRGETQALNKYIELTDNETDLNRRKSIYTFTLKYIKQAHKNARKGDNRSVRMLEIVAQKRYDLENGILATRPAKNQMGPSAHGQNRANV